MPRRCSGSAGGGGACPTGTISSMFQATSSLLGVLTRGEGRKRHRHVSLFRTSGIAAHLAFPGLGCVHWGVALRYSAFRHLLTTRRRRWQVQDLEVLQAWRRGGCGAGCGALAARSLSCRRPDFYFVGCELCRRVRPRRLHGARPSRRLLGAATAATFGGAGGACDGPSRIATRI